MFTGIVEELGTIEAVEHQGDAIRLTVRAATVLEDAGLGDSIAVNGCCLTVVSHDGVLWTADVMQETLDKTSLPASSPATASTSSVRSPPRSGWAATSSRVTSTAWARSSAAPPASTGRSWRSRFHQSSPATSSTRAPSPSTA